MKLKISIFVNSLNEHLHPSFIVKTLKKMKLSGYSELVFLIADAPNFPNNTENDLK